jgi:hypothetical protein
MRGYAPHRQMFGRAAICSSLGLGLAWSMEAIAMMKPG